MSNDPRARRQAVIRDVAEAAGVSIATVSHALNGKGRMSPDTRARVRAGATLAAATPFDGGIQVNIDVTIEIEGGTKPAMVATVVYRRYL